MTFCIRCGDEPKEKLIEDFGIDDNFIVAQGKSLRKLLAHCTVLSIDNNHKCCPCKFGERTLSVRGFYKDSVWITGIINMSMRDVF